MRALDGMHLSRPVPTEGQGTVTPIKKLQENSMYWRYRFFTRRQLAMRRWWRELRQSRLRPRDFRQARMRSRFTSVPGRGMAAANPYARAGRIDSRRGIAFVLVIAAVWTAMDLTALNQTGLLIGVARIITLAGVAFAFSRFW
jgi:hypothetical protein